MEKSSSGIHVYGIPEYAYNGTYGQATHPCASSKISGRIQDTDNIVADCKCNFIYRMQSHCRHLIALGLAVDKDHSKLSILRETLMTDSGLCQFMPYFVHDRWRSPSAATVNPDNRLSLIRDQAILSTNGDLIILNKRSGGVGLKIMNTLSITEHDRRTTYAKLRSMFSVLAENLTKTRNDTVLSHCLSRVFSRGKL